MAIDTRAKRQSAHRAVTPFAGTLPNPDGTVAQADRQQLLGYYGGILAGVQAGFDNIVTGTVKIVRFLAGTATVVRVTGGTVKI